MRRILATFVKEWHMMRRDLSGLALLFVMPMILIIIMALVQDAPFKDYKDVKFDALFLDQDSGKVSLAIKKGLIESKQFNLIEHFNNQPLSETSIKDLVHKGNYNLAIIIPKGTTAEVVNSANLIANEIGKYMGINTTLPHRESRENVNIQAIFDPVSKPTFRMAILNVLEKFTSRIQSEIVINRISSLSAQPQSDTTFDMEKNLKAVSVKEVSSFSKNELVSKMNSVQHNVPAWAIFGMFFMIIIISESMINERIQGSWTRLKLIPGSQTHVMMGKVLFFVLLAVIQFMMMLLVGLYVMPLIGLPSLQLSNTPHLLLLVVVCISLCATSFGLMLGTFFKTSNQALPVGAISVVILSAIGGVWVPVEVLPQVLKTVSVISPMRWGLSAINTILLRNGNLYDIALPCSILLLGSLITLSIAWLIERYRTNE
jgi:ABC-2 type transport system permease protein